MPGAAGAETSGDRGVSLGSPDAAGFAKGGREQCRIYRLGQEGVDPGRFPGSAVQIERIRRQGDHRRGTVHRSRTDPARRLKPVHHRHLHIHQNGIEPLRRRRLQRLGDLARMSVAAVVLGFAFFFVNQAASAFGSAEVIPPWLAAWLPPLLTALAAFTLLFYTEDG